MKEMLPYVSLIISVFGFLITVATLGYYFGRFQANVQNLKEKVIENKVDYKNQLDSHEFKQDKTITRLYEQIEKLEKKETISKSDCNNQTNNYEARLQEMSHTYCGLIQKISDKLNAMEITLGILAEKGKI